MSDDYDDKFEDLDQALDKVGEAFAQARTNTHAVLGHAYAILVRVRRDEQMKQQLLERFKDAKHRDQKNTDDAMRVIKLRITGDRRAAQPYAAVLRKAVQQSVEIGQFGIWLETNGIYPKKRSADGDTEDSDRRAAIREEEWDKGCTKAAKLQSLGLIELPDGMPAENVFAVLVTRKVSGDRQVRVVQAFSGSEDTVLGPLIRKLGRQK